MLVIILRPLELLMLSLQEKFPFKPLTDDEAGLVIMGCGGAPVQNVKSVRDFIYLRGGLVRSNVLLRTFFNKLGWQTVEALDTVPTETPEQTLAAMRSFNRGLLFFAGVIMVVHEPDEAETLPLRQDVLALVGDADPKNFAIDCIQTGQKIPTFPNILEVVSPAFGLRKNPAQYTAAIAGAGALHTVLVQSVERTAQVDAFLLDFPDLIDLEGMWEQGFPEA